MDENAHETQQAPTGEQSKPRVIWLSIAIIWKCCMSCQWLYAKIANLYWQVLTPDASFSSLLPPAVHKVNVM